MTMIAIASGVLWLLGATEVENRWVHPLFQPLQADRNGPFSDLSDGRLWTVDEGGFRTSQDDGLTWSEPQPICQGIKPSEAAGCQILRTKDNTLVTVYLDMSDYVFSWDDQVGEPKEDCRLRVWAIRSLDEGKTWTDKQMLLDGYNANFFGFIQVKSGRLVVSLEHLVTHPGHWVSCSFVSDDDGKTWQRSNLIDIGGHGHHDGATEPTLAELSDGRVLMLIRTNLDRFWQAISRDGGRYWREIGPSPIDASSSPGILCRLRSGRLALVWNRLNPEGRTWDKSAPGPASETPASWHREELSLAFSEDDGMTWTAPLVFARQKGGQLSYPLLYERRPGEMWIVAGFAFKEGWKDPLPLRLKVSEEEILRKIKRP